MSSASETRAESFERSNRGSESFYWSVRNVLFISYKILFRFRHYGSANVPGKKDPRGVILAPNHASYLDPPALGVSLSRRVTFLAKDYLFKHGFVGWILRGIGAYPIKSDSGNDFRSIRDLVRILKQGACVAIFPEGTRSGDGALREPESGIGFLAMKSGAWVMPVYIQGSYEAMPRGASGVRMSPVKIFYGEAFLATEERFGSDGDAYRAVSRHIMAEIGKLKNLHEAV